jgi:predicted transcriptional regulator
MTEEIRNSAIEAKKAASREKREKAISLYKSGMSKKDIAKTLGVCIATVYKYLSGTENVKPKMGKPVSNASVNNDWHGVLKNMVMNFIQKSINEIIAEIPVEEIIKEAVINAVKGGIPQNGTPEAKKTETKKPKPKKPSEDKKQDAPMPIGETPIGETPLEETPEVEIAEEKEHFYTGGSFVDDDGKRYTYARSKDGKVEKVEIPEVETTLKANESSGEESKIKFIFGPMVHFLDGTVKKIPSEGVSFNGVLYLPDGTTIFKDSLCFPGGDVKKIPSKGFPKIKYYNLLEDLAYNSNLYGIYFPVALFLASVRPKYERLSHIYSCLIGI